MSSFIAFLVTSPIQLCLRVPDKNIWISNAVEKTSLTLGQPIGSGQGKWNRRKEGGVLVFLEFFESLAYFVPVDDVPEGF